MKTLKKTTDRKWIPLVLVALCSLPPAAMAQIRLALKEEARRREGPPFHVWQEGADTQ